MTYKISQDTSVNQFVNTISPGKGRNSYTEPISILSTPQAVTTGWVDIGTIIDDAEAYNTISYLIDKTDNNSTGIKFRVIGNISSNPTKDYVIKQIDLFDDVISISTNGLINIQLQVKCDIVGTTAGTINSIYHIKILDYQGINEKYVKSMLINSSNEVAEFETTDKKLDILAFAYNQKTGTYLPIRQDGATNALQMIDYEHHEIHAGSHYFVRSVAELSINQVLDFTFQTANTTKWNHLTWEIDPESETAWYVYENAVITNPLANTITLLNNNRNSANISEATLKYEIQANLVAANADTSVTGSLLIENGITGSGKTSGSSDRASEIVLKQNTIYCFRSIANTAGYINFHIKEYEHTNVS